MNLEWEDQVSQKKDLNSNVAINSGGNSFNREAIIDSWAEKLNKDQLELPGQLSELSKTDSL